MWQTLAEFADAELESNAEVAKRSYEKLAVATWELQKHVKELLCEYPGAVAEEPAIMSVEEPMGREGGAMGHAARLLTSLCAQPARGDATSAPGAIYTPKGDARQRAPMDAGPSVLEGANALKTFLAADVPSMRWDVAATPGPEASGRLRPLQPAAPVRGFLSGQRPTPKLLHVRVDTTEEVDAQGVLQKQCVELRECALAALRGLHSDVSLEDVHGALFRNAVQYDTLPPLEGTAWYKLRGNEDVVARSRQLLAGAFHTSASCQEAWVGITRAFAHGLVPPDSGASHLLLDSVRSVEAGATRTFDVTPESYQLFIEDLEDKIDQLLGKLMRESLKDGGSPRAGRSLSEKDVVAYRLGIMPRTYLQVVGQKLLHHAAQQIPCMAELPERIPDWTLRNLYGRPFAEAVRLALQHGVACVNEGLGPSGDGPDERVRGSKLTQFLLQASAGHRKGGNPKKAETRQQQQPRSERADGAKGRFSFSGAAGAGQRGMTGEQACLDGGAAAAKAGVCQRALGRARSAVELLINVDRDVKGFEEGFVSILQAGAPSPLRPAQPAAQQQQQAPSSPHGAVAYLSVVQEEVARGFREMAPILRTFLYDSLTSAVQVGLAEDDPRQPPQTVPVCTDTWPRLAEQVRQPMDLGAVQVPAAESRDRAAAPPSRSCSSSLSTSLHGGGSGSTAAPAAAPAVRADASVFVRRSLKHTGAEAAERNAPPVIDAGSHRVLEFVAWLCGCLRQLPAEPLQLALLGAIQECLALLMDRLSIVCVALRDMPGGSSGGGGGRPLHLAFLFHSAACCVRRRLEVLQPGLEGLTRRQPHDGPQEADLVRQQGEALVQADELVTSIHQHIVLAYMQTVYDVVLSSLDRTDWCAFRPEVMRGQMAGPAVRVWHSMMLRLLHTAALHASPHAAEWIVGQVLLESMSCLVQRYLRLCPTVQMLREYVADAVHLAASVFLLAQPIPVSARLRGGEDGGGGRQVAGRDAGQEQPPLRPLRDSAKTDVCRLRIPFPMARALAEAVRELLTRAALLHLPGTKMEEVVRMAGLLTVAADASGGAVQPAAEAPAAPAGGTAVAIASGGVRLAPLPAIRTQRPAGPLEGPNASVVAAARPPESLAEAGKAPDGLGASPTAVTSAGKARSRSAAGGADVAQVAGTRSFAVAEAASPRRTDPWVSGGLVASGWDGAACCAAATDEERLGLWASWLPGEVVRALTDAAEAIELGGGSGAVVRQLLIPLGDRMGEVAPEPGQHSSKAEGRIWRSALEQLAQRASAEQVMLALARRQELHAAVGTEPQGNEESRRAVRGVARLLGLLSGDLEDA